MPNTRFRGCPAARLLTPAALLCSLALVGAGGVPIVAAPVAAQALPNSGNDFKDANAYRLTMPKLQAYVRATKGLTEIEDREEDTILDPRMGIAAHAAALERHGGAKAVLAKEGLTPREYALIKVALFDNAVLVLSKEGQQVANATKGVSGANMAFVKRNEAEIRRLLRSGNRSGDDMEPTEDDLAPLVRK